MGQGLVGRSGTWMGDLYVSQMVRDIPGESLHRRMTYKWLLIPFQSS